MAWPCIHRVCIRTQTEVHGRQDADRRCRQRAGGCEADDASEPGGASKQRTHRNRVHSPNSPLGTKLT